MREIKFRVLDKANKLMSRELTISDFVLAQRDTWFKDSLGGMWKDLVYLQYTGLKDKNGKEIYEGDILQDCIDGERQSVKWDAENAWWGMREDAALVTWAKTSEVIGNIYENPELINQSL